MPSLTDEERESIAALNVSQILDRYPSLVLKAYEDAISMRDILRQLGINPNNTYAFKKLKAYLELQGVKPLIYKSAVQKPATKEQALATKFCSGSDTGTGQIKRWILKWNLIPYACVGKDCPIGGVENPYWSGMPITLELDHINGLGRDNRLQNLRFLCPNCHSQTDTFRGKNHKFRKVRISYETSRANFDNLPESSSLQKELDTTSMGKLIAKYQVSSYAIQKRLQGLPYGFEGKLTPSQREPVIDWPTSEVILEKVRELGYLQTGKDLGVSDDAVRKHLRKVIGYAPKRSELRKEMTQL